MHKLSVNIFLLLIPMLLFGFTECRSSNDATAESTPTGEHKKAALKSPHPKKAKRSESRSDSRSGSYEPLADKADAAALRKHVEALVHDDAYRNYQNIDELNRVGAYIKAQMEQHGFRCRYQSYRLNLGDDQPADMESHQYKNVVCVIDVAVEELFVVGAHYDVCGQQEGADDNASGVAGLIELARLLGDHKDRLKYNIEMVAYTLEEPPFFGTQNMGSYVHAKSLNDRQVSPVGMVALEMIGYFTNAPVQKYPAFLSAFYPNEGNFIAAVSNSGSKWMSKKYRAAMAATNALPVEILSAPKMVSGVDFSDHRNYWEFDIDAIMITDTAFYRNKNYHQKSDTVDILDFSKMGLVVDGVATMLLASSMR